MIRNLLALIGLLALIAVGVLYMKAQTVMEGFDPKAGEVYLELAKNLIATKNTAEATVWKVAVEEGVSLDDAEQAMKMVANELNIANVGELPLSKDVAAKSGQPYRFVKIFQFCNSLTAAKMMDYSDAFSAYLPCRISLLEDKQGKAWLYSLNMDMMIHGGKPLPPDLKAEAMKIKETILAIMKRGAAGEF
jgi:uncharacterized protein (DUF302 family)